MRKTTNYGLALYDKEDKMNITAEENSLNANMEIIDNTLKEKANNEDIRTKVSELENDSKFVNETYVNNKIAEAQLEGAEVDLSGYATKENAIYVGDTEPTNGVMYWLDTSDENNTPTEAKLVSITAVYRGLEVPARTNVNALSGILVTANYDDGTSVTVTDYTLSGSIEEGENIITVTYNGLTTTFTVIGIENPVTNPYVSDGLEFRLDAIDNTTEGHKLISSPYWRDISGNNYATTLPSNGGGEIHDTYMYSNARFQTSFVKPETILPKLKDAFTFEVVWRPDNVDMSTSKSALVRVGNAAANYPLLANGQCTVLGSSTLHGTETSSDYTKIKHYALTYDGNKLVLYHEGVLNTSIDANIDLSSGEALEFFGNSAWAQPVPGYFNAVRVYTRALTQEEITSNYNVDIERFGE